MPIPEIPRHLSHERGELVRYSPGLYAVASDLHVGSPFFNVERFNNFVQYSKKRGVKAILTAGDFFEGNDLDQERVLRQDYLGNVQAVASILDENKVSIHSIKGNQDEAFEERYSDLYDESKLILGKRLKMYDTSSLTFRIGNQRVVMDHYAEHGSMDQDTLVIGGHTHVPQTRENFINPGGFRGHWKEKTQIGGYILQAGEPGKVQLERWGELTPDQLKIVAELEEMGMEPTAKYLPEHFMAYPIASEVLGKIRELDPDSIMWLTGSRAKNDSDESIGAFNARFKIVLDSDGNPTSIINDEQGVPKLNGTMSDFDFEIVSSTLTREQLLTVFTDTMKSPNFAKNPMLTEVACYRPEEIFPYLSTDTDPSDHNYFLYRMLLAPTRVIDDQSYAGVQQLINTALPLFEMQTTGSGIGLTEHTTVRSALGYTEFKHMRHLMKKGQLTHIDISPGSYLYDYTRAKTPSATWQGRPPYAVEGNESIRLFIPDYDSHGLQSFILKQNGVGHEDMIITPPLSGYENNIHFGQVQSVFMGNVMARYRGESYNPFTFQVTGPYWDRTQLRTSEIPEAIERNVNEIMNIFNDYGIDGPLRRDDDEKSLRVFDAVLGQWERLGLILQDDDEPSLKVGAALTMFGGLHILSNTNSANLNGVIDQFMEEGRIDALYPKHGGTRYTVMREGIAYYPVYTALSLPHDTPEIDRHTYSVMSGENIATQFGLGHAMAIKALNSSADVGFTETNLVRDAQGRRMTRFQNTMLYETDLMGIARQEDSRFIREKRHDDDFLRFGVMYGVLNHVSVKNEMKFNPEKIGDGLRVLNRLQLVEDKMREQGRGTDAAEYDADNTDANFRRYLDNSQIGQATQYYHDTVYRVSKKLLRGEGSEEDYNNLMSMTWVLFGNYGVALAKEGIH